MKSLFAVIALLQVALNPGNFPQIRKLADNVYTWSDLHPTGLYTTNNLIVITSEGVLIADGQKDADTTRKLIERIKTITPQPIKYVVIGSEHGDHTGGNAAFPATATFVSSPQTLKMGNTEIQIVFNGRAHTGTDLEVYLPKEKIFFVSEVFSNHIFPNARAAVPSEWLQTVKKVRQVDAGYVVPGHGFVDDAAVLKNELASFEACLTYIISEVTRLHASGVTVEAAQKQVNWGPYAGWPVVDRNGPVAVQRVYDELDGKLK